MRASRDLNAGAASTVRVEERGSIGEGEWPPRVRVMRLNCNRIAIGRRVVEERENGHERCGHITYAALERE